MVGILFGLFSASKNTEPGLQGCYFFLFVYFSFFSNYMELPDFMKYKDKFTRVDFVEKIQRIAKRSGVKLVYAALILYYTLESDRVSVKDKAIIIGALGYLISPMDIMPDAIPIAGLSDDIAVLIYVLKKIWGEVSDDVKEKSKAKLKAWFDEEEILSADQMFEDDPIQEPV